MALFGDDMIDVQTPDGRSMKLPRQLAAGFPGLQPIGPAPGMPQPDPIAPDPTANVPIPQAPVVDLGDPVTPQVAPSVPVPVPAPAPAPQPQPASPQQQQQQQQPLPNEQQAASEATGALAGKAAAIQGEAQVAADEATALGDAAAERDRQTQEILTERADLANKMFAEQDSDLRALDARRKEIANTKIDRTADNQGLAMLSVALGAIAAAMQGGGAPNLALQAFYQGIDRKVASQQADLANKRAAADDLRAGIADRRQLTIDKLGEIDARRLAELDRHAKRLETIKLKSGSDKVKAAADVMLADIQGEQARVRAEFGQRSQARIEREQNRKDQLNENRLNRGLHYAQLGETKRHNMAMEDLEAEQRRLAAMKLAKEGKDQQAKLILERAMGGEMTVRKGPDGKPLIGPDGKPVVETGLITTKNGEVWIPKGTETTVSRLQQQHNATNGILGTLDRIEELGIEYENGTLKGEKYQQLKELMGNLTLQAIAAKELGVPTGRDIEFAQQVVGSDDLTQLRSTFAGLREARKTFVRDHNVRLKTAGLDRDWVPPDPQGARRAEATANEKTLTTLKSKPSGSYEQALKSATTEIFKSKPTDTKAALAEARKEANLYREISPEQTRALQTLGTQAAAGDKQALQNLTEITKAGATTEIRNRAKAELAKITDAQSTKSFEERELARERSIAREPVNYDPLAGDRAALGSRFNRKPESTLP